MASDTVIAVEVRGDRDRLGALGDDDVHRGAPTSAVPVGAQEITSPFGTDACTGSVQLASRPTALSVVVAPAHVSPVSEGMVSLGGPADTVTRDRRPVRGAALGVPGDDRALGVTVVELGSVHADSKCDCVSNAVDGRAVPGHGRAAPGRAPRGRPDDTVHRRRSSPASTSPRRR